MLLLQLGRSSTSGSESTSADGREAAGRRDTGASLRYAARRLEMCEDLHGIILAAGFGTRLGALSDERPKPLLPVCDRPLVRWAVAFFQHHGVRQLSINLHHLGQLIRDELADVGGEDDTELVFVPEREILGTGGGIKAMAARAPRHTTVVVNGKIVCDLDLGAALRWHRQRRSVATMVLHPHPRARAWGAIGVDDASRIVSMPGAAAPGSAPPRAEHLFTGIHILEPELIAAIPAGSCCVVRTAYRELLRRGAPLHGYLHRGYFYDHSTPERYLQGNLNLLAGVADPPARPGPLRGVAPGAEVAPDATLRQPLLIGEGARVAAGAVVGPEAVIGRAARVTGAARVQRSVVWPGAVAATALSTAIVTGERTVTVDLTADPTAAPR